MIQFFFFFIRRTARSRRNLSSAEIRKLDVDEATPQNNTTVTHRRDPPDFFSAAPDVSVGKHSLPTKP